MTGPYIITTKRPTVYGFHKEVIGKLAVATLDEAREKIYAYVEHEAAENGRFARQWTDTNVIDNLRESGGTIGPLPDGTVIEVERGSWLKLGEQSGLPSRSQTHTAILAAYNAAQEVKA